MRIIALSGSHRTGKCTAELLTVALREASLEGADTELIELADLNIGYCQACNACLRSSTCSISDDMDSLVEKMLIADGIILGSPDYFSNVSARTKTFIDRTRYLHMVENKLKGKIGGVITVAGLNNCGGEGTASVIDNFFATHEMLTVHPRPEGPVLGSGTNATTMAGLREDGKIQWRRNASEDAIAVSFAHQLGRDMVELIRKLS